MRIGTENVMTIRVTTDQKVATFQICSAQYNRFGLWLGLSFFDAYKIKFQLLSIDGGTLDSQI